jgi:hypothetical protein
VPATTTQGDQTTSCPCLTPRCSCGRLVSALPKVLLPHPSDCAVTIALSTVLCHFLPVPHAVVARYLPFQRCGRLLLMFRVSLRCNYCILNCYMQLCPCRRLPRACDPLALVTPPHRIRCCCDLLSHIAFVAHTCFRGRSQHTRPSTDNFWTSNVSDNPYQKVSQNYMLLVATSVRRYFRVAPPECWNRSHSDYLAD